MRKRKRKSIQVIRFGIGQPPTGKFAVWRLWVQGNETYLSLRSTISQMKASLHSSGKWYFSFSNKQGLSVERPRPILSGITRGPGIIYAGGLVEQPLPGVSFEDDVDVHWYDVPKEHCKKSFTIFFVDKNISHDVLIAKINPKPELLGPLPLREKENIWIAVFNEDLQPNEELIFRNHKDKFVIYLTSDPEEMSDAHALVVQTPNDEIVFLAILLGKENIVVDKPSL